MRPMKDTLPTKLPDFRAILKRVAEVAIFQDPPVHRSLEAAKKPLDTAKGKLADWVLTQEHEIEAQNKQGKHLPR